MAAEGDPPARRCRNPDSHPANLRFSKRRRTAAAEIDLTDPDPPATPPTAATATAPPGGAAAAAAAPAVAPLFAAVGAAAPRRVDLGGGSWIELRRRWMPSSDAGFAKMWATAPSERVVIKIHGKPVALPRLQRTYGMGYAYSGQTTTPEEWTEQMKRVRSRVDAAAGCNYNMCLVNYYADGTQYIGPHSDDVKQLVPGAPIAGLSWGASRRFVVKPRGGAKGLARWEQELHDGDLVMMGGRCQQTHTHEVPKAARVGGKRVSFTFRLFAAKA